MPLNLKLIVYAILDEYALPPSGCHGAGHWARVMENGLRLAETTGADVEVVQLFALFHDSRRISECTDPDHGPRGADFAHELHGTLFELTERQLHLLLTACDGHTRRQTHPDISVQTCWDADRLDLGRVGITPDPLRLCTDAARVPTMLKWADGRAGFRVVPTWIKDDWGIDLESNDWR